MSEPQDVPATFPDSQLSQSSSTPAPQLLASLLTTVFGLITAIILQIFYNLIVAMIDGIVIKMEDASISFLDMLVEFKKKNS